MHGHRERGCSRTYEPVLKGRASKVLKEVVSLLTMFTLVTKATAAFDVTAPLVTDVVGRLFRVRLDHAIMAVVVVLVAYIVCACSLLRKFGKVDFLTGTYMCLFFKLLLFMLLFKKRAGFVVRGNFTSLKGIIRGFFRLSAFASPREAASFPRGCAVCC